MKKKLGGIIAATIIAVMALAGCGSDSADQVRATADGFLSALQDGDLTKVTEYASEDVLKSGDIDLTQLDGVEDEMLSSMGLNEEALSDETKKSLQEFMEEILSSLVKSYEIGDVTESDGAGTVKATITWGFDPDKLDDLDIDDEMEKIATDYMDEHMDELLELYEDGGTDAMTSKVMDELLGDLMKAYSDAMKSTGETSQNVVMTVTKQDDKWLVTDMDEDDE